MFYHRSLKRSIRVSLEQTQLCGLNSLSTCRIVGKSPFPILYFYLFLNTRQLSNSTKQTDAPRLKTLSNNVPDLLDHPGLRHHLRRLLRRGQESQVTSDHTLHRIHTLLEAILRKLQLLNLLCNYTLHQNPPSHVVASQYQDHQFIKIQDDGPSVQEEETLLRTPCLLWIVKEEMSNKKKENRKIREREDSKELKIIVR